jgi:1-deoxy-D-xylulose-5-phosphate reductoisomerase
MARKKLVILGSTGSIGRNALEVVQANPDRFQVIGLAAGRNIPRLISQIKKHAPRAVSVKDQASAQRLSAKLKKPRPGIFFGREGLLRLASLPSADLVLVGLVGAVALEPTLAAIDAGVDLALANKEALVMAGDLVMKRARKNKVKIIPVDSEHSAVFQILQGHEDEEVRRIILSASGGPFLRRKRKSLSRVSPEQALKHPTWKMGKKISVDSATLMNKALEVIEAHHLFGLSPDQIEVVIHPQSTVHALVEFHDGSIMAELSIPDMRIPIGYALFFPERLDSAPGRLSLSGVRALTFEPVNRGRFPAIDLGYQALHAGGTAPCVLNAANEVAVERFLQGNLSFENITRVVKKTLQSHDPKKIRTIKDALHADAWAREKARELI